MYSFSSALDLPFVQASNLFNTWWTMKIKYRRPAGVDICESSEEKYWTGPLFSLGLLFSEVRYSAQSAVLVITLAPLFA